MPNSISTNDGIKASLATLELVKYNIRNGNTSLSDEQIESAHVSLDQIIKTAESIKERLPSPSPSVASVDEDTSITENDVASIPSSASIVKKSIKGVGRTKPPDPDKPGNDTNGSDPPPQRRLSTPCLLPMDAAANIPISVSIC